MVSRKLLDTLVGAFVLLGIGAILFLALRVAGTSTFGNGEGYTLTARFENIGGLKVRAPVKASGVTVGRVTAIQFDNQVYEAAVIMKLSPEYKFPRDTVAKILTSGLLGEQYVGLAAGGDTVDLKEGDTVKMTQSAVVLENLIGQFLYSKAADGGQKPPQ
jgi:phospholipid/cholesterol/gamma-HCH transport system substrate-binding protein